MNDIQRHLPADWAELAAVDRIRPLLDAQNAVYSEENVIGDLLNSLRWPALAELLKSNYELGKLCNWETVYDAPYFPWSEVLEKQPRFEENCRWELVSRLELVRMYYRCPEIVKRHFPDGDYKMLAQFLTPGEKANLLVTHPEAETLFRWPELSAAIPNDDWLWLISRQPQFEVHFDWSRVEKQKSYEWGRLISRQPQFADHCDFSLLDRRQIKKILIHQPQFGDLCDLHKLHHDDIVDLAKKGFVFTVEEV